MATILATTEVTMDTPTIVTSVVARIVAIISIVGIGFSFGCGRGCGFRLGTTFSDVMNTGVVRVIVTVGVGRIVIAKSGIQHSWVGISLGVRLGQALGGREGHSQKSGEHNQFHGDKSFWSSK